MAGPLFIAQNAPFEGAGFQLIGLASLDKIFLIEWAGATYSDSFHR